MGCSIQKSFAGLHDSRHPSGRRHSLPAMITIAICATICGANGFTDIALFGRAKEKWFHTFLDLPHGIPSHDCFGRVFARLKPQAFERCFRRWMKALAQASGGRLIAVDGKTLKRSFDAASGKVALHMVSAFVSANRLVFGQIATAAKSNEITAIPRLLKLLDLHDATVTIDALGCQKTIARQIIGQGGQYVLAVKENQPLLHAKVKTLLDEAIAQNFQGLSGDRFDQTCKGHGRVETRTCWSTPEVGHLKGLGEWAGLASVLAVESTRTIGEKTTRERRYFISSLDGEDAGALAAAVRSHWGVENSLHWSLDVVFLEDQSRVRKGHADENLALVRRIALNLLQTITTGPKGLSIAAKRKNAGWDHDYLLAILCQN